MKIHALALFAVLLAPSARAVSSDCLFDGGCAARPALAASEDAAPVETLSAAESPSATRLSGLKKGASEGALLGFYAGISPAAKLVDEGFGRRMSRGADGPRSDNGGGAAYFYGGIALAAILYIPALVLGGIGGLLGGAAGAAAPDAAQDWDAEKLLFGRRR
jgi:hypothetical protein